MTRRHFAAVRVLIQRCIAWMIRPPAPRVVRFEIARFVPHDAFGEPLALA
jgi:hypothetical protein